MSLNLKVYFTALLVIVVGMVFAWWLMGRAEEKERKHNGRRR